MSVTLAACVTGSTCFCSKFMTTTSLVGPASKLELMYIGRCKLTMTNGEAARSAAASVACSQASCALPAVKSCSLDRTTRSTGPDAKA